MCEHMDEPEDAERRRYGASSARAGAAKSRLRLALALAAVGLLTPAAANAAFAPALDVRIDSQAPGAASGMTIGLGEADGARRVTLRFPPGFQLNDSFAGSPCTQEGESQRSCPATSRLGALGVALAGAQDLVGLLDLGAVAPRLVSFAGEHTLEGAVKPRASGIIDLSLDGLPGEPVTGLMLRLDGGDRAIVRNPAACGRYTLGAIVTGHTGELAVAQDEVEIAGCEVELWGLRVAPARVEPGRGTLLSWQSTRASGPTTVVVQRRVADRWKRVGSLRGSGLAGRNALRFGGRLGGRPLVPGSYRFLLVPDGPGRSPNVDFRVLRP